MEFNLPRKVKYLLQNKSASNPSYGGHQTELMNLPIAGQNLAQAQSISEEFISIQQYPNLELDALLYTVGIYQDTFVIAHYKDGLLLWLDDPVDNSDYEIFLHRENLRKMIPDEPVNLANVITKTKIPSLLQPQLIDNQLDIPQIVNIPITPLMSQGEIQTEVQERDARLKSVADQIISPVFKVLSQNKTVLEFTIWTKVYGYVCSVRCVFADELFSCILSNLTVGVGKYSVQR